MQQRTFKTLFDDFKEQWSGNSDTKRTELVTSWSEFEQLILSEAGLPFDRWVKPNSGMVTTYLPAFIDGLRAFGRARIGNYEQVMIYRNTGSNEDLQNKCYDAYLKNGNETAKRDRGSLYETDISKATEDFKHHIVPLLREVAKARTWDDVFQCESSDDYKSFSAKQVLRRMTQLVSFSHHEDCAYNDEIMWVFQDAAVDKLADILFDSDDSDKPTDADTFFQKSRAVYARAKKWAGIEDNNLEGLNKLNSLLWQMANAGATFAELTNFSNPNLVFHGAPGTGKTYSILKAVKMLTYGKREDYSFVQFHPSYTYQDFIEGIKPFGIKNGNINLRVVNGVFKQFCVYVRKQNEAFYQEHVDLGKQTASAKQETKKLQEWPHYYFIIDEINRGNLSAILGETLFLLERDYRDYDFSGRYDANHADNLIETPLSTIIAKIEDSTEKGDLIYKEVGGKSMFGIPFNIHFIGSMNDVDKSIDTFDLALRRRFKWIHMSCDYDALENLLLDKGYDGEDVEEYVGFCRNLNEFIEKKQNGSLGLGTDYQIGHSVFMKIKADRRNHVGKKHRRDLFDSFIEPVLKEYIREVAEESEIATKIDLAKKQFGI